MRKNQGKMAGNIFLSALIIVVLIANVKALHNRFGSGDMCSYQQYYLPKVIFVLRYLDKVKPNHTSHYKLYRDFVV